MLVSISTQTGDCLPRLEEVPEVTVWNTCLLVQTDNTTVMHYLTWMGGGHQVQDPGQNGLRDNSVVLDVQHFSDGSPYFWLRQCGGGSPLVFE